MKSRKAAGERASKRAETGDIFRWLGGGISREDRGKIFERFYRADRARSRGVDGFGLGLSLAQAIFEGHGGSLVLAETSTNLTVFEVLFPGEQAKK